MIDVHLLRTDPEGVKAALARRRIDVSDVDRAAALDVEQRELATRRDELRARVKGLSKEVGRLRGAGRADEAAALQDESKALGDEERSLAGRVDVLAAELRTLLLGLPNLPAPECPDGADAADNPVLRTQGYDPAAYAPHQRVAHWDIGAELGILDLERGAKLSGSMFVAYRGWGARLERALVQLALDRNGDAYEEIRPPTLVRTETATATGHLPKFSDELYAVERDGLWAVPTAEVPLTSMYRDEILTEDELPKRMMAYTSCFRREAGAAGRDTRGLLRVHEFDKVELLALCTPEQAAGVHADILDRAERIIADLGLAHRVVDLCTGDLSASSARTFDIEVYAPGVHQWLEVSSVSWFRDYQARRANLRYRPTGEGRGTAVLHTLNGSGLAVPRVWAALVETHRQPDGSILLPGVLRPHLGGAERIPAR
ncbi:MAG: serine--tRNA ligase [Acidimicrobiales bacterium]|nr:serine--tRNA ligase [Acidimicrobiales bacterium]